MARRWRVAVWRPVVAMVLLAVTAVVLAAMGLEAGLPLGATLLAGAVGAVGAVLLAAAYVVVARPARHRTPPQPDRIEAPVVLTVLLLSGCTLFLVGLTGLGLATILVPELFSVSRRTGPGAGMVLLTLCLANAWWLSGVFLGTPRARLDLAADGLRYRGGRTDRTVAWSDVRSVGLADRAERLVVRVRGGPPVRVPVLLFDVRPGALVDAVEQARRRHRR